MVHKITFFNHKGGVGKTTSVFHIGWMLGRLGKRVLLVDADSQCNLTKISIGENYEQYYIDHPNSNLKSALSVAFESQPKLIEAVECYQIPENENVFLLPGSFDITEYEVQLGVSFQMANSFGVMKHLPGAFNYLIEKTAHQYNVEYILIDLNPSLGALNQDVLISSDYFIIPCSPDYFSKMAIESLAQKLPSWERWAKNAREFFSESTYPIPFNTPKFLGYTINDYTIKSGGPTKSFQSIIEDIAITVNNVLVPNLEKTGMLLSSESYQGEYLLSQIPNFQSFQAKYQQYSIPIFELTAEQIGSTGLVLENQQSMQKRFYEIFQSLTEKIIRQIEHATSPNAVQA
ncbi:MAG: ParA family protein [Runella sp.]